MHTRSTRRVALVYSRRREIVARYRARDRDRELEISRTEISCSRSPRRMYVYQRILVRRMHDLSNRCRWSVFSSFACARHIFSLNKNFSINSNSCRDPCRFLDRNQYCFALPSNRVSFLSPLIEDRSYHSMRGFVNFDESFLFKWWTYCIFDRVWTIFIPIERIFFCSPISESVLDIRN